MVSWFLSGRIIIVFQIFMIHIIKYYIRLKRLAGIHELKNLPWLVGGDLNVILFDTEKSGLQRPDSQLSDFLEALDDCGYTIWPLEVTNLLGATNKR